MNHILAQAIKLPGLNGRSVNIAYPAEFKGFFFQGSQGTLGNVLGKAMPVVIGIAGLGLLLMLISAGYTFMTSAGDAKKMEKGKQQLSNAILGFIIVFGAYWLVQIVGIMFGSGVTTGFK